MKTFYFTVFRPIAFEFTLTREKSAKSMLKQNLSDVPRKPILNVKRNWKNGKDSNCSTMVLSKANDNLLKQQKKLYLPQEHKPRQGRPSLWIRL